MNETPWTAVVSIGRRGRGRHATPTRWERWRSDHGAGPVRRLAVLLVVLALLLGGGLGPASAEDEGSGGSISGYVSDEETGLPMGGAWVCVGWEYDGMCLTAGSDGRYRFDGLSPGSYRVHFSVTSAQGYAEEYYDNASSREEAAPVIVGQNEHVDGVDAQLSLLPIPTRTQGGLITDSSTGEPLEGISVCLMYPDSGVGDHCVTSGADGLYEIQISGYPGSYFVGTWVNYDNSPGHRPAIFGTDWRPFDDGDRVENFELTPSLPGVISGTVTSAVAGQPLSGIEVCARTTSEYNSERFNFCTLTDDAGAYAVDVVGLGYYQDYGYHMSTDYQEAVSTYIVSFYDPGGAYKYQRYDQVGWEGATGILVDEGQEIAGIDGLLEPLIDGLGSISGWVRTDSGGQLIEGVEVCAQHLPLWERCSSTGPDGTYTIEDVPPGGPYNVWFTDPEGRFLPEYWNDATDPAYATRVWVAEGESVTGIFARLAAEGSIAGTVTSAATGDPVEHVQVCAWGASGIPTSNCTNTGQDGTYLLINLAPGSYDILFSDRGWSRSEEGWEGSYQRQWYPDSGTRVGSSSVELALGEALTGIDAAMQHGGNIEGLLTDDITGLPLPVELDGAGNVAASGYICAEPILEGGFYEDAYCERSIDDGTYRIGGLVPGDYRVKFSAMNLSGYVDEYYDDVVSPWDATTLTVGEGATITEIDGALSRSTASIRGVVTDGGQPVEDIEVCARSWTVDHVCATSDGFGEYLLTVEPGSYWIEFTDVSSRANTAQMFATEVYPDKATFVDAQIIDIEAGESISDIDAELEVGGVIAGLVTDEATGDPIENVYACWLPVEVDFSSCPVLTDATGGYEMFGIKPGSYRIQFHAGLDGGNYVAEYFDDASTEEAAQILAIDAGLRVDGVDAALAPGATLSGTVTTSIPEVTLISVGVFGLDGLLQTSTFAHGGEWTIEDLPSGHYRIAAYVFTEGGPSHVLWYGGSSQSNAAVVHVGVGEALTGIDISDPVLGSVAGTVVGASSGEVALFSPALAEVARTPIGADGTYAFGELDEGEYFVVAFVPGRNPAIHQAPGGGAQLVAVTDGTPSHSGIDIVLSDGASVSGQVSGVGGGPYVANSAAVQFWAEDDVWLPTATVDVEPDGSYSIDGVPAGSYKVRVASASPFKLSGWYGGTSERSAATIVELAGDSILTGIDLGLRSAGAVSVNVTSGGEPLPSGDEVEVLLFKPGVAWMPSYAAVAIDGTVVLTDVLPGEYEVMVRATASSSNSYQQTWNGGAASRAGSVPIRVEDEVVEVGVDVPKAGVVSGHVLGGGRVRPGGAVRLFRDDNQTLMPNNSVTVRADGSFDLVGVAAGTYHLMATSTDPQFTSTWLGGGGRWSSTEIVITEGGRVSGLIVELPPS